MKYLLYFLLFLSSHSLAQSELVFNKRFVESEDRWVAFNMGKDSSYPFGFIYVDAMAGLTFNREGSFKMSPDGKYIPLKIENANLKVRLQPNNVLVAFIPENKFNELSISKVPDWLTSYKGDTNSVSRLYRWGFLYNGWNECAKALTYLERAQQKDPGFKGLGVELAFSYNCLHQYEKAIIILKALRETQPTDAYINKELIYAQVKLGRLEDAAASCKTALALCPDQTYNGENCYNLLHELYVKKDKTNFLLWVDETKKWTANRPNLVKSIQFMEAEMNK
jgi:tetratricopeptide (TPR) repeat protein